MCFGSSGGIGMMGSRRKGECSQREILDHYGAEKVKMVLCGCVLGAGRRVRGMLGNVMQ